MEFSWHKTVFTHTFKLILSPKLKWMTVGQWSLDSPAQSLLMSWGRIRSVSMDSCCVPVCPPGVSVALCCFSSVGAPSEWISRLSTCQAYDPVGFSLLTVCAFLSFHHPKHSHSFYIFLYVRHHSFSPSYFILSVIYICDLASLRRFLCCGGLQKRSGQMVSEDFRALLIATGNSLVLMLVWCSPGVCRSSTFSLVSWSLKP